jgi:hypothetical protein
MLAGVRTAFNAETLAKITHYSSEENGEKRKQERERNTESKHLHSNYSHSVETLSDSSKDGIAEKKQTRRTLHGRCPIATRGRTNESGNDDGKYTHEDNTNKIHTLYSTTTRHCTIRRQCERKYIYVTIQKTRCSTSKNIIRRIYIFTTIQKTIYSTSTKTLQRNIHIRYNTKEQIQSKYEEKYVQSS